MKLYSVIAYLIVSFTIGFIMATHAEKAKGDELYPFMHIGSQISASDARMAGGGLVYNGKLDISVTYMGEGSTEWGDGPLSLL